MNTEPTLDQRLAAAHEYAQARFRADCTDELRDRVYAALGNGVRVSSVHIRTAGVSERDLFCMEAAGLARLVSSFTYGDRVTNTCMRNALLNGECIDQATGLANLTELAELAAHDLGHDEWLDDETHEVWDLAIDVADAMGFGER